MTPAFALSATLALVAAILAPSLLSVPCVIGAAGCMAAGIALAMVRWMTDATPR